MRVLPFLGVLLHCLNSLGTTSNNFEEAVDLFEQANALFSSNQHADAIPLYRRAIALAPDVYAYHTNLGHALLANDDQHAAVDAYTVAARLLPTAAKTHYNLGRGLQLAGELRPAVAAYDRALVLEPSHVNALYNRALALQDDGDLDAAFAGYTAVLAVDPSHADARLNSCNVHLAHGSLPAAEACYKALVQVHPDHARGVVNLAAYYHYHHHHPQLEPEEQGKNGTPALDTARRDALRLYERALALEPTNAMAAHGRNALLRDLTTAQVGLNGDAHTDAASADPARSGLAAGYVRELFDSYAFAFDASLFALNYQSHLLVGEAVGKHVPLPTENIAGGPVPLPEGPVVIGLDLGAGTGLACAPLKHAVAHAAHRTHTPHSHHPGAAANANAGAGAGAGADQAAWEAWAAVAVGIVGVDLSPKMLAKARQRGCYGDLIAGDVHAFLDSYAAHVHCGAPTCPTTTPTPTTTPKGDVDHTQSAPWSLPPSSAAPATHPLLHFVAAADVFCYLGDLRPVVRAAAGTLLPGGVLVFTVEALGTTAADDDGSLDGDGGGAGGVGYALQGSGRVAHTAHHVRAAVAAAGLRLRLLRPAVPRWDRGQPVQGYLVVAARDDDS